MTLFYIAIDIYIFGYLIYSWYCQATIDYRAHYRISTIVWAVIFLALGFSMDYFTDPDLILNAFIAAFIVMSVVDGFSGFGRKHLVLSGYFRRTVKYSELQHVTLIQVPSPKKPIVMAVFQTNKRREYTLRFTKQVEEVIYAVRKYVGTGIAIDVRQLM